MMGTELITTHDEIPDAPFYVVSRDRFLSGWGNSEGKDNILIIPCDDGDEACIVATNARNRTDQEAVRIFQFKPTLLNNKNTYSLLTKETGARWYRPGAFS